MFGRSVQSSDRWVANERQLCEDLGREYSDSEDVTPPKRISSKLRHMPLSRRQARFKRKHAVELSASNPEVALAAAFALGHGSRVTKSTPMLPDGFVFSSSDSESVDTESGVETDDSDEGFVGTASKRSPDEKTHSNWIPRGEHPPIKWATGEAEMEELWHGGSRNAKWVCSEDALVEVLEVLPKRRTLGLG